MKQPRQLFLDTLCDFLDKLGSRAFWDSHKAQEIAIEALLQDYMRVEHGKYLKADAGHVQSALDEYHRRMLYMLDKVKLEVKE